MLFDLTMGKSTNRHYFIRGGTLLPPLTEGFNTSNTEIQTDEYWGIQSTSSIDGGFASIARIDFSEYKELYLEVCHNDWEEFYVCASYAGALETATSVIIPPVSGEIVRYKWELPDSIASTPERKFLGHGYGDARLPGVSEPKFCIVNFWGEK